MVNIVNDSILSNFYKYAKTKKIEQGEEDINPSVEMIKMQIKALIARNIWKTEAYYRVMNEYNPIFKEALKAINNKKLFKKLKINSGELTQKHN